MKGKRIKLVVVGVVLLGVAAFLVFRFTGGREYSSDLNALKTQFNQDKGKPRLLVLLSPT
jgi:hypothetical protein